MSNKRSMESIIDFVTNGDISDLSDLSDEDDFSENEDVRNNEEIPEKAISNTSDDDEDDDVPLASVQRALQHQQTDDDQSDDNDDAGQEDDDDHAEHFYRWRKADIPVREHECLDSFSPPPEEPMTPLNYFLQLFPEKLLEEIVYHTNLYSTQKSAKSINCTTSEMKTFIGMNILMGIIKLPFYYDYWSTALRIPAVADAMPRNRFSVLRRHLHFVDNNADHDPNDKLLKIRPIIEAVRNEAVKVEPEEFHSVDEQIVPSKTKYSSIRQYNPKKPKKWGFKNLVRAGASGFMYDFYVYAGKDHNENANTTPYQHLQKCAQVVAKLSVDLPHNRGYKLFFDNWFTTLDLLLYLQRIGILAVGTVRANRLRGCPLENSKTIQKKGRGSVDYRTDYNSGIILVKWVDNSVVQLASNFVGVQPMGQIERWVKSTKERKNIDCPSIVLMYNKSMGGVDLADMLIALYRMETKTTRWYVKLFWHLVDIAKVNSWLLYRRHQEQFSIKKKNVKGLKAFSQDLAEALIHANKSTCQKKSNCGRPAKRKSTDEPKQPRKATLVATPCTDVRHDQMAHWPIPVSDKKRCRLCQAYSRMTCSKCKVHLCLITDRNCFLTFHQ